MTRRFLPGKLFIISAPSGSGKTTLCKKLLEDVEGLSHSVSVTTRRPRKGERHGRDYHFVTTKDFQKLIMDKKFLEYEENFGNHYGTLKSAVKKDLSEGKNLILSIDVKGAMNVRKSYPENSVLIFILPPSISVLKKRLETRKSDEKHEIAKRLDIARKELSYKDKYDYRVINDKLETAYRRLKKIILYEIGKTR